MSDKLTIRSVVPRRDRLALKLAVLFCASFVVFFLGNLAYDSLAQSVEAVASQENSKKQPLALDPKIERDLANATSPDNLPTAADVQDPFKDRAGISNNSQTTAAASKNSQPAAKQNGSGGKSPSGKLLAGQMPAPNNFNRADSNNGFPLPGTTTVIPGQQVITPTTLRYRAREESLRAGQPVEPESAVFSIEDLLPVGVVSGGNGEPEIMLYSQSLTRTMSFPVGTRFFDGWLVAWRPEGIEFGFAEARGEVRLKTWARTVKQPEASPKNSLTAGVTNGN